MTLPTPHQEKLRATLSNDKLPERDKARVKDAIGRYGDWIRQLGQVRGDPDQALAEMVRLLSEYKKYIDLELIFASEDDFLYRQKGQLKLDNSIIEEFLPWLLQAPIVNDLPENFSMGPTNCYSAIYFQSSLSNQKPGAGIRVRTKDQDFAVSRKLFIKASHSTDFSDSAQVNTYIAYVATEIKTNLDKTMFQEACATARDLRVAVPGARYFLMCEWLDMTPVSTAPTDIEEVLIMRGAKRMSSNIRKNFSSANQRQRSRGEYEEFLGANSFRVDVFRRWTDHIKGLLTDGDPVEKDVLEQGHF
jgi:hypothetical protein